MLSTRGKLLILTYHRVCAQPDRLITGNANAAGFTRQMQLLGRAFRVLTLTEAVERMHERTLPARAVCITFDDGYADNVDVAAPILHRHGLPATFFIATGFIDGGRMWNDTIIETVRAARGTELDLTELGLGRFAIGTMAARAALVNELIGRCKYLEPAERKAKTEAIAAAAAVTPPADLMMRSEQVRALHRAGMEIGAHTVSHPILSAIPPARAREEIVASRDRLATLTGAPVRTFAYPNGKPGVDYGSEHVDAVRAAGFDVAVSTVWGAAESGHDRLQLPRVGFSETSHVLLGLKLLRAFGDSPSSTRALPGYASS
jgi:peptidoglycan/xylan/chitin deacetylase (PgdA/CDA1 family)